MSPRLVQIAVLLLVIVQAQISFAADVALDYDFYRKRVEPIFLKKRPGHGRCYVCHSTNNSAFRLQTLSPGSVKESRLAGEQITATLTRAPGNNAPIGGLKVVASSGWFAARPSGTENIYKLYAESFQGEAHLNSIVSEAQEIVDRALNSAEARG